MVAVSSIQTLRRAVSEQLDGARRCIFELQQAELPLFNVYQNPKQSIVNFLHAAHGVLPVIKTFAEERQQRGDFENWRKRWEAQRLTDDERALWLRMLDERIAQNQGEEAHLIRVLIPITHGDMSRRPGPFKWGMRFLAYPTQAASEVCRQYLELCERFWQEFDAGHCWLIAS